jgi:hypothetical protein
MYGCADLYSFNRLGPLYGRLICYGSLLRVYRMCISGGVMIIIFLAYFGSFWVVCLVIGLCCERRY